MVALITNNNIHYFISIFKYKLNDIQRIIVFVIHIHFKNTGYIKYIMPKIIIVGILTNHMKLNIVNKYYYKIRNSYTNFKIISSKLVNKIRT